MANTSASTPQASVLRRLPLPNLPSASGMEWVGDRLYIIGDDSPWLYVLDAAWQLLRRVPLLEEAPVNTQTGRIPKPLKPDFESLTYLRVNHEDMLLVAGSGSLSPQRDTAYLIALRDDYPHQRLALDGIYSQLRTLPAVVGEGLLNIEGTAANAEHIYLL